MSRFFSSRYTSLVPYVPGEQPQDMQYIKLNTNENPFPPIQAVTEAAEKASHSLQLYPDPEYHELVRLLAQRYRISAEEVLPVNGSDEILNFAFMAFCDDSCPAVFADITYGFYSVFAEINHLPYRTVPLRNDFTVNPEDYYHAGGTIFLANPNAPTSLVLSVSEIEGILQKNPDNVVVIDEAYVDFSTESCVPLIHRYPNLLVTQTFSKSRSMAGARLGFGIGCKELIRDLTNIKFSTNPYNVNRLTAAAGIATLQHDDITEEHVRIIVETREETAAALRGLGFVLPDSSTNFLFAKHPSVSGQTLYAELKKRGILVRHFTDPKICDYNRITIGTPEQMQALISACKAIVSGTE